MSFFLQVALSGLALGCVYGLVALGVVVIFSATRLLNFAQGEFLMLGGLTAWWTLTDQQWPFPLALVAVIAVGLVAGAVVSKLVVSQMISRGADNIAVVIATLAVSIVLAQGVARITGPQSRGVPSAISGDPTLLGGAVFTKANLSIVIGSLVALAVFAYIRNRTRIGLSLRAVGANRAGARVLGMSVGTVETVAFALSGAVAAFAGLLVTPVTGWTPTMGLNTAILGFIAAIVGGIASPYTAFAGGLLIGLLSSVLQAYLPPTFPFATAILFAVLILVIAVRPSGLVPSAETRTGPLRS
jgi:branched-chain amino acid transport system permease protein